MFFFNSFETVHDIHSVICFPESRIKNQPEVNNEFDDYNFINISLEADAEDVAVYIHSRIRYIRDKRFSLHGCECIWLNLFQPLTEKKLAIATIYRHPGVKVDKSLEDYSHCLEQLFNEKKTF